MIQTNRTHGRLRWTGAGLLLAFSCAAACALDDGRGSRADRSGRGEEPVATFSIVAYDPDSGELGVAVESKFFAVGAVVPWARAGVGAVATQSFANTTYGPRGLELLAAGASAAAAVATLTAQDEGRAQRQLGIVDASGGAATFTGEACLSWAGGRTGDHYAAQGNILAGPGVVDAMAVTFESTTGDLATRLVTALAAGQAAGGDARGRQSAALLVVRDAGGYGGYNDRYIDLRVDDHPTPIAELRRLLDMRHGLLAATEASRALRRGDVAAALEAAARATELDPELSGGWLTLAAAYLASGDEAAAVAAAREALLRDPWIKKSAVEGGDLPEVIARLLEVPEFALLWETLPARR